jgi:gluconate 2-dehydrogenase gamma chain
MKRRELLQCAALLAAGTAATPKLWALTPQQSRYLAAQSAYIDSHAATYFTPAQRATVGALAQQIIPTTDTPGAVEAGVPKFIELMVADWFNDAERSVFIDGMADLQRRSGGLFADMSAADQLDLLESLEAETADHPWYNTGETIRVWDDSAPFICQIKELTVLGFVLSDVGSTQFLRTNSMGSFEGNTVLASTDAAYTSPILMRVMAGGK